MHGVVSAESTGAPGVPPPAQEVGLARRFTQDLGGDRDALENTSAGSPQH
ncbi:MAG: hypothetical protein R2715_11800 [Ilumatobacteraceae bacterium]